MGVKKKKNWPFDTKYAYQKTDTNYFKMLLMKILIDKNYSFVYYAKSNF